MSPAYKCIVCETKEIKPDYPWDKNDEKVFKMCASHATVYKIKEHDKTKKKEFFL